MDDSQRVGAGSDPKTRDHDMLLLPPNYFAIPTPRASSHDPLWTRSAMQEELERLRTELVELRRQRSDTPRTNEPLPTAGSGGISVLNEVLAQQAAELSRMRTDMERERAEHRREVACLQGEVEDCQRQAAENEEAFQIRFKDIIDDYERRLNDNETEANLAVKEHEADRVLWQNQIKEKEDEFRKKFEEKCTAYTDLANSHKDTKKRLKAAEAELSSVCERLDNLKVCESWPLDRIDMMRQKEDLDTRLQSSEAANQLKQQRLDTLQTILLLQENELAKHVPSNKKIDNLLCRWREKVFTLMVQAESLRLSHDREIQKSRSATAELEQILDHTRCIATTNELKLQACKVELLDEKENSKQLLSQLNTTKQAYQEAAIQNNTWSSALQSLRATVESMGGVFAAKERELESKTLTSIHFMERRLANICDRLPVIKAHMKRLRAKEASNQLREEYESRLKHLEQEFEMVRTDRDRLARQMESDAEEAAVRERSLRGEYESEMCLLKQQRDSLKLEVGMRSERLDVAEMNVADLQIRSEAIKDENEQLIAKVSHLEKTQSEVVRNKTTQLFEEHSQQVSQLQAILDEVRRELTTAALALRQTERELEHSRSEHAKDLAALRQQAETRIAEFQKTISSLEAERNLLRATVRQEGLLRASDVTDMVPVTPESPKESMEFQSSSHAKLGDAQQKMAADFSPHLANLIDEVRCLVRSVEATEDNDISDDED